MKTLNNKIVLITGAGSGIGQSMAVAFARAGARIVITDINEQGLQKTSGLLGSSLAGSFKTDHTSEQEVRSLNEKIIQQSLSPDVLCANVGMGIGGPVEKMDLDHWRKGINVNIYSTVYMIHFFLPELLKKPEAHILITASVLGLIAMPGTSIYSMTKFAMTGLSEALRSELAERNIGVTALCPGIINTNIIRAGSMAGADQELLADFYSKYGATPDEVALDAVKAVRENTGVMPTPLHAWPLWLMKRLSVGVFQGISALAWQNNFIRSRMRNG